MPRRLIFGTLYVCCGLPGCFHVCRQTTGPTHAQLSSVFHRCSSHHGHCVLRGPGSTLQGIPGIRSLIRCRKPCVQDLRNIPFLVVSKLVIFQTFVLPTGPTPYSRGGSSSVVSELGRCPPQQDRWGIHTVALVSV